MREIDIDGRSIDSGPTVFTMPWVFEELFGDAGSDIHEHLRLRPAEVLARHAWRDGGKLDLFADIDRSAAAIAALSGADEAKRYRAFCKQASDVYQTLYQPFIRSQRPGVRSLVAANGLRGLRDLWRIRPFESLWRQLGRSFRDRRLRNLFARYATYCGSSPLQAPATLMLIAHVEQSGVCHIEGGMQRLAEGMADLTKSIGGRIHYDTTVDDIECRKGRVTGVRLTTGETLSADVVVANADVAGIRRGLLGRSAASAVPAERSAERSLSAVTWSLLGRTAGFDLAHHNVFFPEDYPREFEEIFEQRRLPTRPAVYVCAQDRDSSDEAAPGRERLFVIANAPPNGDREACDRPGIEALEASVFDLLEACGLRIEVRPEHRVVTTPADFEARFPGTGGALYGAAAHGWRASFTRPGARSRLRGLYLAGGSVHPGAGVPMVAISGRLAAEAAAADLGLSADNGVPR
jgi:1-hydroxycarotenoid 3,4-desaturase